ncbi:hypothetical protein HA466_0013130 [Hirschfeldia incana]|nr:hypothetical protein HA466_0013130 [Hirschfeldia incana]
MYNFCQKKNNTCIIPFTKPYMYVHKKNQSKAISQNTNILEVLLSHLRIIIRRRRRGSDLWLTQRRVFRQEIVDRDESCTPPATAHARWRLEMAVVSYSSRRIKTVTFLGIFSK